MNPIGMIVLGAVVIVHAARCYKKPDSGATSKNRSPKATPVNAAQKAMAAEIERLNVNEQRGSRSWSGICATDGAAALSGSDSSSSDASDTAESAAVEQTPFSGRGLPGTALFFGEPEAPGLAFEIDSLPSAGSAATRRHGEAVGLSVNPQSMAETAPGARSPSPNGVESDAASEPSPVRELRSVIHSETVIAARDAHRLSHDPAAMIHSDSPREIVRLTAHLAEMRSSTYAEIEAARLEMEEAKRAARETEREAELAKATMQSNLSISASAAMHELEVERLRSEEMKLQHAKTIRSLHEGLIALRDRKGETEMHSLQLNDRLKSLIAEFAENNAIEFLLSQIAVAKPKADSWSQYSEDDFKPAVAASSNRSISPLHLQVARLSAELEECNSIAWRLNIKLRALERMHQEVINGPCEKCYAASTVSAALRRAATGRHGWLSPDEAAALSGSDSSSSEASDTAESAAVEQTPFSGRGLPGTALFFGEPEAPGLAFEIDSLPSAGSASELHHFPQDMSAVVEGSAHVPDLLESFGVPFVLSFLSENDGVWLPSEFVQSSDDDESATVVA